MRAYLSLLRELSELSRRNQAIILLTIVYALGAGLTWAVSRLLRKPLLPYMDWSEPGSSYWIERPATSDANEWKRPF
jgi:hypothetical protein